MTIALTAMVLLSLTALAALSPAVSQTRVTVRPREIDDVLYNPGIGFMTKMDLDGEVSAHPKSTVAQWDWYWDEIEPTEGGYRWDLVDEALRKAKARGQQLAIRLGMPANGRNGTPQWYRDLGTPGWEYPSESGPVNWMPDHNDPRYVKHMGRLIREFGQRYDGHPDIVLVDIRSLGHWGEWHFHFVDKPRNWNPRVVVTPETRRALVDMYLDAFKRTPLVMLIGGGDELAYAVRRGAGWRGDFFGYTESDGKSMESYQHMLDTAQAHEAWKHGPVVLESCHEMQYWVDQGYDVDRIFAMGLEWHASLLNEHSSSVPPGYWGKIEAWLKKLGYRLVLRSLSHPAAATAGGVLPVEGRWENVGVAPPYRPYLVAWKLSRLGRGAGDGLRLEQPERSPDITTWLPGVHEMQLDLKLPEDLRPGRYRLAVALLDPDTKAPAVQLAIEGCDSQGWYNLSEVQVTGR